ncbi:hypothetical protein DFR78_1477 [Halanaerobium sp. MA284_MarDTE_T2]|nr:hypothetical protein DFR78_1477 [Halanaerobium sp. MA284_MarDTE_T2]
MVGWYIFRLTKAAGKIDKKWVENYCHGDNKSCQRYQMEEKGEYHPDNMLPDGSIDQSLS